MCTQDWNLGLHDLLYITVDFSFIHSFDKQSPALCQVWGHCEQNMQSLMSWCGHWSREAKASHGGWRGKC